MKKAKVKTVAAGILAARKMQRRSADARQAVSKKSLQERNSCFVNARRYRVASGRSVYAHV
jgi:hypothetical protein